MDLMSKYRFKKALKGYDVNDLLERIGLERRSPVSDALADVGFFALGCLCGTALGVLFAPRRGSEMRHDLRRAIGEKGVWAGITEGVKQQIQETPKA